VIDSGWGRGKMFILMRVDVEEQISDGQSGRGARSKGE
jgi:hypothetical protein